MNTFGINRPVNSFGLGILLGGVAAAWQEIIKYTLYIRRIVSFTVER